MKKIIYDIETLPSLRFLPSLNGSCSSVGMSFVSMDDETRNLLEFSDDIHDAMMIAMNSTYGSLGLDYSGSMGTCGSYMPFLSAGNLLRDFPDEVKDIVSVFGNKRRTLGDAIKEGYISFTKWEIMEVLQKIRDLYKIRILRTPETERNEATTEKGKISIGKFLEETMLEEESEMSLRVVLRKVKIGVDPNWVKIK